MIISFNLMTCIFDQVVVLLGEISCLSLLQLKGLMVHIPVFHSAEVLSHRSIVDGHVSRTFLNHDFCDCTFAMPCVWKGQTARFKQRESNPWPSKYLLDTLPLRYGRLIVSTTRQLGSYVRHMTCLTASVNNGRAIMNLQRTWKVDWSLGWK